MTVSMVTRKFHLIAVKRGILFSDNPVKAV
jgi:hypothetical protein